MPGHRGECGRRGIRAAPLPQKGFCGTQGRPLTSGPGCWRVLLASEYRDHDVLQFLKNTFDPKPR